jgi:hypothetical protein
MNDVENLKSTQLIKSFRILKSSPVQSLKKKFGMGRQGFIFYKSEQVSIKEKHWFNRLGLAHGLQWHMLV